MADLLQDVKQNLSEGKNTNDWYNKEVTDLVKGSNPLFKMTSQPDIGKMYLFVYDPKLKQVLPYYDMFPLIIPIKFDNSGFLALNLHYLNPNARATLLNALMTIANNQKYDESTKINISYDLLKGSATKFSGYKDCIKRYLYGFARSSFHVVPVQDWAKVVLLPLQRWQVNSNPKYASSPPY